MTDQFNRVLNNESPFSRGRVWIGL